MEWLLIALVVWIACAALAAGRVIAAMTSLPFTSPRDFESDAVFGWVWGLLGGPLSLLASLIFGTRHGLMYRNPHRREVTR